uniref:Putative secreted peptide n=1 Tax=Anopheles braziliensis TaxID=58242 RepID=A0A2M3ZVU9_9DIPT
MENFYTFLFAHLAVAACCVLSASEAGTLSEKCQEKKKSRSPLTSTPTHTRSLEWCLRGQSKESRFGTAN